MYHPQINLKLYRTKYSDIFMESTKLNIINDGAETVQHFYKHCPDTFYCCCIIVAVSANGIYVGNQCRDACSTQERHHTSTDVY